MTTTADPAADTGLPNTKSALSIARADEPDPALVAIVAWERAWYDLCGPTGAIAMFGEDEDRAAAEAEEAAHNAVCSVVATTAVGLAAQLRFAYGVFGDAGMRDAPGYREGEPYHDPSAYTFGNWADERDATLLGSLLAGAERLAGGAAYYDAAATPMAGDPARTPILRLFYEARALWVASAAYAKANLDTTDEEMERLFYQRQDAVEEEMYALPCTCAADMAAKLLMSHRDGEHSCLWRDHPIWAEALALTGVERLAY